VKAERSKGLRLFSEIFTTTTLQKKKKKKKEKERRPARPAGGKINK
jgi:hypothetical protein